MINPFAPGTGIIPPCLAGRGQEINWFKKALKTALTLPQNMVISGIRGTGKTVLLMEFEKICDHQNWLFLRKEFNRSHCYTEELIVGLLLDLAAKLKGLSSLLSMKPKIGFLSEPQKETIDNEFILSTLNKYAGSLGIRLESTFKDIFSIIEKADYKGLVLLLDEFHNVEDNRIKRNYPLSLILETFSHLQQRKFKLFLVLAGLPPLYLNLVNAKTYAERMFSVWNIENLNSEDTKMAISKPLKSISYDFSQSLIEKIILLTKGNPYLIQFFCHFILENIPKRKVDLKELQEILPFLYAQLDNSFFRGRFSRATPGEQDVLFAMAEAGENATPQKIKKSIKISKSDLSQRLESLCYKNLIFKMGRGKYYFAIPAFREFLQRERMRPKSHA